MPAIGIKLIEFLWIIVPIDFAGIFIGARLTRPPHLPHQPGTLVILPRRQLENFSYRAQRCRQSARQRRRHRAGVPLERNDRPIILSRENALLDRALECVIMGDGQPIRIRRRDVEFVGNRLAGNPDTCRRVVDRIGNASYPGHWITGVAPGADVGEIDRRPGLDIAMKNVARIHGSTNFIS